MNIELITTKEGWMVFKEDSHLSRWIEQTGRLDCEGFCNGMIVPHIKPGWHVVDGGASLGDHTLAYSKAVGDGGLVMAFEPFPPAVTALRHNMQHAGVRNVAIYEYGLSDKKEAVKLEVGENKGALRICGSGTTDECHCITLDSLDLQRLDLLKLDIEGYELFALKGAERTIRKLRPLIMLEMNLGCLKANGFNFEDIYRFMDSIHYEGLPLNYQHNWASYDQIFMPL